MEAPAERPGPSAVFLIDLLRVVGGEAQDATHPSLRQTLRDRTPRPVAPSDGWKIDWLTAAKICPWKTRTWPTNRLSPGRPYPDEPLFIGHGRNAIHGGVLVFTPIEVGVSLECTHASSCYSLMFQLIPS